MSQQSQTLSMNERRTRNKNFLHDEDLQLCRSWLAFSNDSIIERDQKSAETWKRIIQHFRANFEVRTGLPLIERKNESFISRWSTISRAVSKFCGYFEQVWSLSSCNDSGFNEAVNLADILYFKGTKKKFVFHGCWLILRDEPKWQQKFRIDAAKEEAKQRASEDPDSNKEEENKQMSEQHDMTERFSKSVEELLEATKKKIALLERARDTAIMDKDLSKVTNPRYRAYLEHQQKKILDRWIAEEQLLEAQNQSPVGESIDKNKDP